jgi:hypothetical protein
VWHADNSTIDFLLNKTDPEHWSQYLASQNMTYTVLFEDLQKAIDKESEMLKNSRRGKLESFRIILKLPQPTPTY